MKKVVHGCVMIGVLLGALVACKRGPKGEQPADDDIGNPKGGFIADSGFRPTEHGYPFRNTGGKFPRTPGLVTNNVMVKLFGKDACIAGNTRSCKLTPPAAEWSNMINRAMNGGQCEGMAVSSLTFFKNIDKAGSIAPGAKSAHNLQHAQVAPLIGYYWAFQAVNPVMRETLRGRRTSTPNGVVEKLTDMWKRGELATIGFWGPPGQGGHAVTPYAIEDRGNGIQWIRIYDNNYPDKERYITIDKNANTWRYDLAAINPAVPKMPWGGSAENHNIVVIPLEARLKGAECPFCRGNGRKTVVPRGNTLSLADQEGRQIRIEGDKVINEIPDAEIVDLSAFLEGAAAPEPMFILPGEHDYDITIGGKEAKPDEDPDEDKGVTIFGEGNAIAVEETKLKPNEKDTIAIPREGSNIRYKTGTGRMPALKMAVDDEKTGLTVRIGNMKADADDEVELKLDSKAGRVTLQGGGKKTDGYDIKLRRSHAEEDDDEVEHKAVKFRLGESHAIDTTSVPRGKTKGAAVAPLRLTRGTFVPRPRKVADDKAADKDTGDKGGRGIVGDKDTSGDGGKRMPGMRVPAGGAGPATKPTGAPPPAKPSGPVKLRK